MHSVETARSFLAFMASVRALLISSRSISKAFPDLQDWAESTVQMTHNFYTIRHYSSQPSRAIASYHEHVDREETHEVVQEGANSDLYVRLLPSRRGANHVKHKPCVVR